MKGKDIRLVPFGTRCLVKRHRETKTEGGLFIPKGAEDNAMMGTVMAVGELCDYVKVSDEVFFNVYSGRAVNGDVDTKNMEAFNDVLVMVEDDILCKVERLAS